MSYIPGTMVTMLACKTSSWCLRGFEPLEDSWPLSLPCCGLRRVIKGVGWTPPASVPLPLSLCTAERLIRKHRILCPTNISNGPSPHKNSKRSENGTSATLWDAFGGGCPFQHSAPLPRLPPPPLITVPGWQARCPPSSIDLARWGEDSVTEWCQY